MLEYFQKCLKTLDFAACFRQDFVNSEFNLIPGRSVILLAGTAGLPTGVSFPTPNSRCLNYMGGLVANPIFLFANGAGQIDISLPPVLPDQFRLFVQAFAFQPGSVQCTASTRGTWFGLAEQR